MTNKSKQMMLRMETYAMFPYLIEITKNNDDGTTEIYRYANCYEDVVFENKTFKAGYFKIEPPEEKQTGFSDAKLTMSAIDPEENWIGKIRSTQQRADIRFVATIEYDENNTRNIEVLEDNSFTLTNVQWNDTTITWTMKFDELLEINVPFDEITTFTCPALG